MKKYTLALAALVGMLLGPNLSSAEERVDLRRYVPSAAAAAVIAEDSSLAQLQEFLNATPPMREDLSAFLKQRLGVDLTQVDGFVLWATNLDRMKVNKEPALGAFVRVKGNVTPLKGKVAGTANGVKFIQSSSVYLASVPGGVLIGNKQGIRMAASLSGKQVSKQSLATKGHLADVLKISQSGDVVAAFAPQATHDANFKSTMAEYGIQHLVITANPKLLRLEAIGDGQKLEQARAMLEGLVAMVMQKLGDDRSRALSQKGNVELGEGMGSIVAYHQLKKFWDEFRPQLRGNRLVSEYRLPDPAKFSNAWGTWIGVMSALALPKLLDKSPLLSPQLAK